MQFTKCTVQCNLGLTLKLLYMKPLRHLGPLLRRPKYSAINVMKVDEMKSIEISSNETTIVDHFIESNQQFKSKKPLF